MSPTLTAEELTNQVLEMRATAAGTDLWVTFEIREYGELGEYDQVCVHVFGGGGRVTMTSVLSHIVGGLCSHDVRRQAP